MQLSIRLKIILLCSLIVIGYTFYVVNKQIYHTKYQENVGVMNGTIIDIKKYSNRISFVIKSEEKVLVNYYGEKDLNLKIGDIVKISGKMSKPKDNSVFYLFNYKNYLLSKKIYWTFILEDLTIVGQSKNIFYRFKDNINNYVNQFNNDYLNAFIIGDNSFNEEIYESYQINGISHLFSISGGNIIVLATIFLFFIKLFMKNVKVNFFLVSFFLIFYMFLTDFSAPVVRSCLLFIGIHWSKTFKKEVTSLEVLIIILLCLLLYNPYYVYDIGFKFSFIISFYLILFSKLINKFDNYFIQTFVISLLAFLVSLPIVINSSFTVNLLTPLLNMIFVPLGSVILFPMSLFVFVLPFLNHLFEFLIKLFESLSLFASRHSLLLHFSYMPFYVIILYYIMITYILYGLVDNKYSRIWILLPFLIIHYNINYLKFNPEITVIDVGQGDAHLIILPNNQGNILIDTGGSDYDIANKILVPYLRASGVKKIDYLVLTHGDFDHMGASLNLVKNFKVSQVIMNSYEDNALEKELINELEKQNIAYYHFSKNNLKINNYNFYFLNTRNPKENNDSLIVYTKLNNKNILFMGDATKDEELKIINEYKIDNVDILKVGHHGSKTSTSSIFLDTIKPKMAVIPVASKNMYGHPNPEVINRLNTRKIDTYLTSINGSIKFILGQDIIVKTCYLGAR